MLNDILLLEEKHTQAAEKIAAHILNEESKEKYIIAISGESGSGKSELAYELSRILKQKGWRAKPIHIDNYYKSLPAERNKRRELKGVLSIGYDEYNWNKIYNNIHDFKTNRKSTLPCVDILTDQIDELTTDFQDVDMLIIDGLYAIKTNEVNLRIFIELTQNDPENIKAQEKRKKEQPTEFRKQVLQREHEVVQSLAGLADIIVTKKYEIAVVKAEG